MESTTAKTSFAALAEVSSVSSDIFLFAMIIKPQQCLTHRIGYCRRPWQRMMGLIQLER